jgi:hypothetical protein
VRLDIIATRSHYLDHIAPVWDALPERRRGSIVIREVARERAETLGLPFTLRDAARNPVLVTSAGDLGRANRFPNRPIALMNHGIGGTYGRASRPHVPDLPNVSLLLFASDYVATEARKAYPGMRIEVTGSPFADWLPRKEPGPQTVAISFHWDTSTNRATAEKHPALPHYRAALPEIVKRFHVIGHGHPKSIEEYGVMWEAMGVEVVREFTDVCRRADLYVCDTSSSIYEFAATGRPVVLLNAPWYRRHINQGVMRFWSGADVGIQVDEPDQLADAIERALQDEPEQRAKREAIVDKCFAHRGHAAQVTADVLVDWMQQTRRMAA